ncbi:hypothetical protein BaRGS_00032809 [Batillaria attramentaria]|uniref:Uncharacterized protein n=1 Tax=Batillaria attramentaria TaxID=370345 RepID=A0ABD0JMF0_9CAEN
MQPQKGHSHPGLGGEKKWDIHVSSQARRRIITGEPRERGPRGQIFNVCCSQPVSCSEYLGAGGKSLELRAINGLAKTTAESTSLQLRIADPRGTARGRLSPSGSSLSARARCHMSVESEASF